MTSPMKKIPAPEDAPQDEYSRDEVIEMAKNNLMWRHVNPNTYAPPQYHAIVAVGVVLADVSESLRKIAEAQRDIANRGNG